MPHRSRWPILGERESPRSTSRLVYHRGCRRARDNASAPASELLGGRQIAGTNIDRDKVSPLLELRRVPDPWSKSRACGEIAGDRLTAPH